MRTFVGLAVVVAVIYGLYWILRQVKAGREERAHGTGLRTTATVPLGSNRALHLVRAGNELVLVGVADHAVTPIRTYTEEEARAAGLLVDDEDDDGGDDSPAPPCAAVAQARPARHDDRRGARARAPGDGACLMPDGQNAVEILLLVGGVTLLPAALFTLTGFTRILIVLGFIRTGLGTPTAPPNQVLVGIALFLTLFVMMPTFKAINEEAIQPLRAEKITVDRRSTAVRSRCASSCSSRRAIATSRCS